MTIVWNEVTIWWNEVTKGWNEVAWNEVVMERSDRIPTNDIGESTLEVGEQTVGETTRRRNDRKPSQGTSDNNSLPVFMNETFRTVTDGLKSYQFY